MNKDKIKYKISLFEIPLIPIVPWDEEPLKDPLDVIKQREKCNCITEGCCPHNCICNEEEIEA